MKPNTKKKSSPMVFKLFFSILTGFTGFTGMAVAQDTKKCLASMIDYFTTEPSPTAKAKAAKFMKIQSEITMNRLLYVYLQGARKKIKTSPKIDSEEFGIKIAITTLMKERSEYNDEYKKFNEAPISTKSLTQILPAISNLITIQEEERIKGLKDPAQDPEAFRKDLLLGEIDVKLLTHLSGGDDEHPVLRYARLINSKVIDKQVDTKSLEKALGKLSEDQNNLLKKSDFLIQEAMTAVPDCAGLSNCSEMSALFKSIDFLGPVMKALYHGVKLQSSDLPDLFKDLPKPVITNPNPVKKQPRKPRPLALNTRKHFLSGILIEEESLNKGENKRDTCLRIRAEILRVKPNLETTCASSTPFMRLAFGGADTVEEAMRDGEAFKAIPEIPFKYRDYTVILSNDRNEWTYSHGGSVNQTTRPSK